MASSLGQIGQNGVNEFFEDLTYNVAYSEVLSRLNKVVDVDNAVINDALKSALSIMVSSALFLYIQKQEEFLYKIYAIVGVLVAKQIGIMKKGLSKLRIFKGRKLKNFLNFFVDKRADSINLSRMAIQAGSMIIAGDNNVNSSSNNFKMVQDLKANAVRNDEHKLNIARSKVASINETLLFKLFSKKFTPQDKELVRRITGSSEIDIQQLNKVADFMYVSDDKGNITGLTEEFMTMLNGLGYMHNKVKKA